MSDKVHTHEVLADVVNRLRCKPGWTFRLNHAEGEVYPKLVITVPGWNSARANRADEIIELAQRLDRVMDGAPTFPSLTTSETIGCLRSAVGDLDRFTVSHWFPVPEATYGERAWRRWIFECCRGVENHELGEWFRDGAERPFSPLHGPGELPYVVHEFRPVDDALTTQDGGRREPYE